LIVPCNLPFFFQIYECIFVLLKIFKVIFVFVLTLRGTLTIFDSLEWGTDSIISLGGH
jgi:hypothetical protein